MNKNPYVNYFLDHGLLNKGISILDIFMALFEFDPAYEYQLEGASKEEIDLLEKYVGIELPDYYKDFLLLAGRRPKKYYMYGKGADFVDFSIGTLLKLYENIYQEYSEKEKEPLKERVYLDIALPKYTYVTDHPDELDSLTLNFKSGALTSEFINYSSLQELLFSYGFKHLKCGEPLGYFCLNRSSRIKMGVLKTVTVSICDALLTIPGCIQHPYSSGALLYFSFPDPGIEVILNFAGSWHEYIGFRIDLYYTKSCRLNNKYLPDATSFLSKLHRLPFIKDLGLEYHAWRGEYYD
jgi:hypothetical protein